MTYLNAMAQEIPALKQAPEAAPESQFRMAEPRSRANHIVTSGRTAMVANISVQEPKPPDDPDSPLSFLDGRQSERTSRCADTFLLGSAVEFRFSPSNKFQSEIGGPLKGGDPGVRLIEPAAGSSPHTSLQFPACALHLPGSGLRSRSITFLVPTN